MLHPRLDHLDPANYDFTVLSLKEHMAVQEIKHVDVPDWIWGIKIDWAPQYGNSISIGFIFDKAIEPSMHGEAFGNGWEYTNGRYVCEDARGLCDCHYAKALREDPKLGWVTPQEEGYGGRHFKIKMKDGRDATLRGPWYSGAPPNYREMTHAYATERDEERRLGFMFGLYMHRDLYYSTIAETTDDLVVIRSQFKEEYPRNGKMMRSAEKINFGAASHPIPKDAWTKEIRDAMPQMAQIIWRK